MNNATRRRSVDRRLVLLLILIGLAVGTPVAIAIYGATQAPPQSAAPTFDPNRTGPPPTVEGLWRIKGIVVDSLGHPIPGVCIAIGPHGCSNQSPRTDNSGWYYFDLPVANVDYDLHYTKTGYAQFDAKLHPDGPTAINAVILAPQ